MQRVTAGISANTLLTELFGEMPRDFWGAMTHALWRADWADPFAASYATLNLVEAAFWFGIAAWVVRRHIRRGGGRWNWAYASAFVAFDASDVVESIAVTPGLIVIKGLILAAIIALRLVVVRRYYPGAKM